jgi:hypothetical protein
LKLRDALSKKVIQGSSEAEGPSVFKFLMNRYLVACSSRDDSHVKKNHQALPFSHVDNFLILGFTGGIWINKAGDFKRSQFVMAWNFGPKFSKFFLAIIFLFFDASTN